MKNLIYLTFAILLISFASCVPRRSACPAFNIQGPGKSVYATQDGMSAGKQLTPEQMKANNKKMLDEQATYIRVKRNKKTGLVVTSRRAKRGKKGKRTVYTDKGFSSQPGNRLGVDIYNKPALEKDKLGNYKTKD